MKELRLSNNPIGDAGGFHVADGINRSTSLKVAHLSDTKVSGQTALKLVEMIRTKGKHMVKDLDISNNLIIMDDIDKLADAFKESQIECLNIRGNFVSAEEIIAFEQILLAVSTMSKRKFIF